MLSRRVAKVPALRGSIAARAVLDGPCVACQIRLVQAVLIGSVNEQVFPAGKRLHEGSFRLDGCQTME